MDGFAVVERLHVDPATAAVPVVILCPEPCTRCEGKASMARIRSGCTRPTWRRMRMPGRQASVNDRALGYLDGLQWTTRAKNAAPRHCASGSVRSSLTSPSSTDRKRRMGGAPPEGISAELAPAAYDGAAKMLDASRHVGQTSAIQLDQPRARIRGQIKRGDRFGTGRLCSRKGHGSGTHLSDEAAGRIGLELIPSNMDSGAISGTLPRHARCRLATANPVPR